MRSHSVEYVRNCGSRYRKLYNCILSVDFPSVGLSHSGDVCGIESFWGFTVPIPVPLLYLLCSLLNKTT